MLAEDLNQHLTFKLANVISQLEIPKDMQHGHLALPVFQLARELKKPPSQIAVEIKDQLAGKMEYIHEINPVAGYVNFSFKPSVLYSSLAAQFKQHPNNVGYSDWGRGKTVAIDFSSPNIAKPMHVGHLRATIIGKSLSNLAKSQGFKVLEINHIGDWGTQFGKLAWSIEKWGHEYDLDTKPIDSLLKLYVRFHEEEKTNPELSKAGAETFQKLESGDPKVTALWRKIIDLSYIEYQKLYDLLRIKHEFVIGESFYNDKLDEVENRLNAKNLLSESEGAKVVFFPESQKLPPCIVRKSDGASIYATRDLAAAIYRHEQMHADTLLYVVAQDQSLHFKQIFKVLEMMGYEWHRNCHHISFGLYRLKEGKMSTRQGNLILFEDVLNRAFELVKQILVEKSHVKENSKDLIRKIAVGALLFNDLRTERSKDVEFDWDKILNMQGDSGPFLQYTTARCHSLMKKASRDSNFEFPSTLNDPSEINLAYTLLQFQDVLTNSYTNFKPNVLSQYLLELAGAFGHFYHKVRIIGAEPDLMDSRLSLVKMTAIVFREGLEILNIEVPESM